MPAKGETYNRVGVDLAKWARDYMRETNLKQAQLARSIYDDKGNALQRQRVNDIVQGKANTVKYLQMIVESCYGGDYLRMGKYAMDAMGMTVLKRLHFERKLPPNKKKLYKKAHDWVVQLLEQDRTEELERAISKKK